MCALNYYTACRPRLEAAMLFQTMSIGLYSSTWLFTHRHVLYARHTVVRSRQDRRWWCWSWKTSTSLKSMALSSPLSWASRSASAFCLLRRNALFARALAARIRASLVFCKGEMQSVQTFLLHTRNNADKSRLEHQAKRSDTIQIYTGPNAEQYIIVSWLPH